tara:strand:- start:2534 stop:3277 length:744 start_codon:yes stop_codon:yes gene_type:complete
MDLVSIILPYYKKSSYIDKTIYSILKQTYENFEIIIVDDEQSTESEKVLKKVKSLDSRIFLIKNSKNLGAGYSRNEAIKISKGKYLAFCDCDDLWNRFKLEKQIKFMISSRIEFSFTSYEIIDEEENIIGERKALSDLQFRDLLKSCDIGLSTVILERKIIKKFDVYFPNLKTKEDYVLWLKLSNYGIKMFGLNENLASWRKSNNSLSSSAIQKVFDGYKVYRLHLKYGIVKSLICLIVLSVNKLLK